MAFAQLVALRTEAQVLDQDHNIFSNALKFF